MVHLICLWYTVTAIESFKLLLIHFTVVALIRVSCLRFTLSVCGSLNLLVVQLICLLFTLSACSSINLFVVDYNCYWLILAHFGLLYCSCFWLALTALLELAVFSSLQLLELIVLNCYSSFYKVLHFCQKKLNCC